jgi:V8-like Glu-specific endopeptidase
VLSVSSLIACTLSITSPAGSGWCAGTLVSPKHILTAAHCFPKSAALRKDLLIITECAGTQAGAKTEIRDEVQAVHIQDPNRIGVASNDLAIVQVSHAFSIEAAPRLTQHPGMYFGHDGRLNPKTNCRILGRSGRVIELGPDATAVLESHSETHELNIVTRHRSGEYNRRLDSIALPGDSGGALICRAGTRMPEEIIGVTSSILTPKGASTYDSVGNRFTPVFTASSLQFLGQLK